MTPPDTSSAAWQNFYLRIRSALVGRELPLAADAHEFPPPSKDAEATHSALVTLLKMPELVTLFKFFRQELVFKAEKERLLSSTSTEGALRSAKAFEECINWMPEAIVNFVAEFDAGKLAYANWLEEKQKREQHGGADFSPPAAL